MTLVDAAVIVLGLLVGSFLNVCIHRIPKGQSVVLPASRCPSCQSSIRPWHNIPVISFLLLRGRCSKCGSPISWIYPAVEILTSALFYLAFLKYSLTPAFAITACFFSLLIVLNFIDLHERILPDVLTLGGTVLGFLLAPLQSPEFFVDDPILPALTSKWVAYLHSFAGIMLGGGVLWLVGYLYWRVRKIEGMGFGDVKMMAMVGAFLGWRYAWSTIFFGSLLGAIAGTLYIRLARKESRYELPFGTFLAIGALFATLWGPAVLRWYLALLA